MMILRLGESITGEDVLLTYWYNSVALSFVLRDLYKQECKRISFFFFLNVNTFAFAEINSAVAKDKDAIEHLAVVLMGSVRYKCVFLVRVR